MARPLRIEYPGAWYHVMNRGRRAEKIFHDRHDYQAFVELLEESSEMWNIRVAAYCLMTNHCHILVQTPDANISRSMRHINGVYTQRFNKRHRCDGQLFRGRYKSILVSGDSYLLQLVRYIHRNPVNDQEITRIFESKKWPSILGPETFIDWVKGKYYALKADQEVPQAKDLAPETDLIITAVCKFYDVSRDELYRSRRGQFNEPRNVAIFLTRKLRRDSLKEISHQFHMEKYSSISSIIERMKKQMSADRNLQKRVDRVADGVSKSQEQT